MRNLLSFLLLFITAATVRAANPAFTAFVGTNGVVVKSNVSTGKIIIGPAGPLFTSASQVWTNDQSIPHLADTAIQTFGFGDTNTFFTRNVGGAFTPEDQNLGVGYQTGNKYTSGDRNSMFGNLTGARISIGDLNSAFGYTAMQWALEAANNAAFGARAMQFITNGSQNCAFGLESMEDIGNGTDNCAFGYDSLDSAINVFGCSAYGSESFHFHVSGDYVTGYGYRSGFNSQTRAFNTFLGAHADLPGFNSNITNATSVGFNAKPTAHNQVMLGNPVVGQVFTSGYLDATLGMPTNAAPFNFITTNLLTGQSYTNFSQRGHVVATVAMTNILAGDVSAMALIVDQNADGTWDTTNGPVRINGVALSAGEEQLFGLLQPGARFAFTNQSEGTSPSAAIRAGSCQWSRW